MKLRAVLGSDLHFSQNAPVSRAAEPDWFAAQKRYIDQVAAIVHPEGVPFIVAGDIFDKWYAPSATPELVNALIDSLPKKTFAIPGQHDLPEHRYDARHRSPFGTLVRAGAIQELCPGKPTGLGFGLVVWAFPWGFPVKPLSPEVKADYGKGVIHLAVVHEYIWVSGHSYPGASLDQYADRFRDKLAGYDAAVFGDNHKGFMVGSRLINCGTFLRRKSDERDYRPMVGLLYSDGHIEPHYLDTSADLWAMEFGTAADEKQEEFQAAEFVESVKSLSPDSLDFQSALSVRLSQPDATPDVRRIVLEAVP